MTTPRSASTRRAVSRDREGDASLTQYLREIQRYPLLRGDQERDLAVRARAGDAEALDALVRANLRFVVFEAKRFRHYGLTFDDLIGEGNVGLLMAARRFDPTRGVRFVSYAAWWVRQAMLRALTDRNALVRVPARLATRIRAGSRFGAAMVSLDADVDDEGGTTVGEVVADTRLPHPEEAVSSHELSRSIEDAFDELGTRDAEILQLYFGLDARGQHSAKEIGRLLDLSVDQVQRFRDRALERLRRSPHGRALAPFAA